MKNFLRLLLVIIICCSAIVSTIFLLQKKETAATTSLNLSGAISVIVTDSQTNERIENATVCVLELHAYYQTNKNGCTELIYLNSHPEKTLNATAKEKCSYYTLLIYKNGYADHLAFDVKIRQNQNKVGYHIKLSPIINEDDPTLTSSYEEQSDIWMQTLANEYKR